MKVIPLHDKSIKAINSGKVTAIILPILVSELEHTQYIRFISTNSFYASTINVREKRIFNFSEKDNLLPQDILSLGFNNSDELFNSLTENALGDVSEHQGLTLIKFELISPQINDEISVLYEKVSQESFADARTEIVRDLGWGSWTDDFPGVWELLNIDRGYLDERINVRISNSNEDTRAIRVSIPAKIIDWQYNSVPALLSLVAGDVLGSSGVGNEIFVKSVDLPQSVKLQFPGPNLGIDGIRNLCNVPDRPIVAFSVKPRLGFTSEEFASICIEAAEGGVDIVEDDERLSNQSFSSMFERAEKTLEALHHKNLTAIYSVNITGRADKIVRVAEDLIGLGVRLLKIDVLPTGFSALQAISELLLMNQGNVGITVYPAMSKMYERALGRDFILELCRLCGADVVYAGIPPIGSFQRSHDQAKYSSAAEYQRLLKRDLTQKAALPTISTNLTPKNAGAYRQLLGDDIGFFVGAGISAYKGGIRRGAELFMKAVNEAAKDDERTIFTDEESELCDESNFGAFVKYSEVEDYIKREFNDLR